MEAFDITNKSPQSLGTSLNRGSTVLSLEAVVTVRILIKFVTQLF